MIKHINSTLSIIRTHNIIIAFICCLISAYRLGYNPIDQINLIISFFIVFLLVMSSNIFNDIFDIQTDAINRPLRPLIKYPELKFLFLILGSILLISAISLSFFLNFHSIMIVICSGTILTLYTPIFKKIPLIGNLIVAFFLSLVFFGVHNEVF